MQHELYGPQIVNDPYKKVADGQSCAARGTRNRHLKKLRLIAAAGRLESVTMDTGYGSVIQDNIRQSACTSFGRPMNQIDQAHTIYYTSLGER